jgi:cytidine deaminase
VGEGGRIRTVLITDLLPESYVWADHRLEAEQSAPLSTS